jgi:hypothetical protein
LAAFALALANAGRALLASPRDRANCSIQVAPLLKWCPPRA